LFNAVRENDVLKDIRAVGLQSDGSGAKTSQCSYFGILQVLMNPTGELHYLNYYEVEGQQMYSGVCKLEISWRCLGRKDSSGKVQMFN
jgi:hypothetical protein